MDRLARAGWLSHRPERLDGQLRRAAPCRPEGWYLYHGGDGQFPGQSADEQIAAHALVAARGQSPPPSSLRRLQWYAWFWLRTEILPSQRYATASGDCRLNPPNLRRSPQDHLKRAATANLLVSYENCGVWWRLLHNSDFFAQTSTIIRRDRRMIQSESVAASTIVVVGRRRWGTRLPLRGL